MDGYEFELSNLKLDLRIIPDSLKKFPHKPKDVSSEVPKNFESKFLSKSAKNHSLIKLTWEEADPK